MASREPIVRLDVVTEGPPRPNMWTPPPDEVEGDVFDRQRVMVAFDHARVVASHALVLGCGGLGSNTAMCLARMGVGTITLLDYDTVDASNLNRQILFSVKDVGRRKVDAAKDTLDSVHALGSTIIALHMNAVAEWGTVVELIRKADVVFNCIDYGGLFDQAVNSVTSSLGLPCISGSSYANTGIINYYSGRLGESCFRCMHGSGEAFPTDAQDIRDWMSQPDATHIQASALLRFHEEKQLLVPDLCIQHVRNALAKALEQPDLASGSDDALEDVMLPLEHVRAYFVALGDAMGAALLPGAVETLADARGVIPKDAQPQTRFIGSWVVVCTSAACLMVNAWVQHMAGHTFPNFANVSLFDSTIATSLQDGATGQSEPDCAVCAVLRACNE